MRQIIALLLLIFSVAGCYAGVRGGDATKDKDDVGSGTFWAPPF